MKTKHAIIILLIGFCLTIIGSLFKIMHWPFANIILPISMFIEVIGIILVFWKILTNKKLKDILNS